MSKAEKVVGFYDTLLNMLDITANEEGLLTHSTSAEPIMVNGKRLALPTKDNIKLAGREEVIVFHPLSENVFEGMSDVFIELRYLTAAKIHKIITYTAHTLIKLVLNKAAHENLSDKQMGSISQLADADPKFLETFKTLMNSLEVNGDKQLINIFMKYGGELKGEKYMRIAFVSFPLLEEIDSNTDNVIYGVKFRKKDIALLKAVFNVVIPQAFVRGSYSVGSNSSVAPYFSALLLAFCNVIEDTASTTWRFRSYIEEEVGESQHVTAQHILDKLSGEESILDLVNAIPPMPHNTGDNKNGNVKDDEDAEDRSAARASRTSTARARKPDPIDDEVDDLRNAVQDIMGLNIGGGRGPSRGAGRETESIRRDDGRSRGLRETNDRRGARPSPRGGLRDAPNNYRVTNRDDMEDLRRGSRGRSVNPLKTLPRI